MPRPKADLVGTMGLAWKADTAAIAKGKPHASVASWYINAPWAHPAWSDYALDCLHLRPMVEFGPPKIYLPGATHELILAAIDPRWQFSVQDRARILHPMNFAAQFMAESDEAAVAMIEKTVREIIGGVLNPDTDARGQWIERFGANMMKGGRNTPDAIVQVGDAAVVIGTGAENIRTIGGREGKN